VPPDFIFETSRLSGSMTFEHLGPGVEVLGGEEYAEVLDEELLGEFFGEGVADLEVLQAQVSAVLQVACLSLAVLVGEVEGTGVVSVVVLAEEAGVVAPVVEGARRRRAIPIVRRRVAPQKAAPFSPAPCPP